MVRNLQRLKALISEAMALQTDANIWWLALEKHHRTKVYSVFFQMIDDAKPSWMPRRLWNWLHRM